MSSISGPVTYGMIYLVVGMFIAACPAINFSPERYTSDARFTLHTALVLVWPALIPVALYLGFRQLWRGIRVLARGVRDLYHLVRPKKVDLPKMKVRVRGTLDENLKRYTLTQANKKHLDDR